MKSPMNRTPKWSYLHFRLTSPSSILQSLRSPRKYQSSRNYTHLRNTYILACCSVPPLGDLLFTSHSTTWRSLVCYIIHERYPTVRSSAVCSARLERAHAERGVGDLLGPRHCCIVNVRRRLVKIVDWRLDVNPKGRIEVPRVEVDDLALDIGGVEL